MNRAQLINSILEKKSFLCVGLDPDQSKMPPKLSNDIKGIQEFLFEIIDSTRDLCVAYKPNTAFYEVFGAQGWQLLDNVINYIGDSHFVIADAKRGDIGNTSKKYAEAFFNKLNADAITVAPYMGSDSVKPFLEFKDKWTILLGLTSNKGADDFQYLESRQNVCLFQEVLRKAKEWGNPENLMFVIGATQATDNLKIREILPDSFLLVPGIGAQGGDIHDVCDHWMTEEVGLLVNSSRSILYASNDDSNYANAARNAAKSLQVQMAEVLKRLG